MSQEIDIGDIKFSADSECFEAMLTFNNKLYNLTICDFGKNDSSQAKALALKIKDWLKNNLWQAKEYAASKLLNLKNENWLSENEEPLTHKEFTETIEFEGINAFSEGAFEIYFNDRNLFGGHTIIVDVSKDFEYEDANIAG